MYTTNPSNAISTIHFLNDQNIVQDLSATELSIINPIPSLDLLDKVNKDLGKRIDDEKKTISLSVENLSGVVSKTNLSVENLSGLLKGTIVSCETTNKRIDDLDATVSAKTGELITSISQTDGKLDKVESSKITDAYVDEISENKITNLTDDLTNLSANYVKKAGDSISNLTVDNDLVVKNTTKLGDVFEISKEGYVKAPFIQTKIADGIIISGQGEAKTGKVKIDIENAADNVIIGNTSLAEHIKNAIDDLDVSEVSLSSGQMIGSIKEDKGKISVNARPILSTDIPELPQEKIAGLTADYVAKEGFKVFLDKDEYTKNYFKSENTSLSVVTGKDLKKYIVLTNGDSTASVNVDQLIVSGIVTKVEVLSADGDDFPKERGPWLKITYKDTEGNVQCTRSSIKDLIQVYTSGDGVQIKADNTINADYTKVTSRTSFDPIEKYVHLLSDDYDDTGKIEKPGVIHQLSDAVQESFLQNVRNVKFDGCIKHYVKGEDDKKIIGQILADNSEVGSEYAIRNNSLYRVAVEDDKSLSTVFTSFDGVAFTNSDYILVHKDDASIKRILPTDLSPADVFVVKTGVSKIDLDKEADFRTAADTDLSNYILSLDSEIDLVSKDDEKKYIPETLSVLTRVEQEDGKVTFEAKQLLSSDVTGLSNWVKARIDDLDISTKTFIEDSTTEGIKVLTSLSETDGKISYELKDLVSSDISGLSGYVTGYVADEIGKLSYASHDLYSVSSDIISVITELKQNDGKIEYTTKTLDYTNVSGLTDYVKTKIESLDMSAISSNNQLIYAVSETDGIISAYCRSVTSSDFYDPDASEWNKLCVDLVAGLPEICATISNAVHNKVYLKNPTDKSTLSSGGYSDLSVIKLQKDEYEKMVIDGTVNESCLYVVSSDYIDAYGEQLCNLTMQDGGYEGIAATKPYVDEVSSNVATEIKTVQSGVNELLLSMWNDLSACYTERGGELSNYTCGDAISAVFNLTKIIGAYVATLS